MKRGRSWTVTIHEGNMKKAGLSDDDIADYEYVAEFFKDRWEKSREGRKACVATCMSKEGKYHLHAYLYGNTTTDSAVASYMYDSHVEEVADKKALSDYLPKTGKYAEKGETVLYITGEENIKSKQGHRADLDYIQSLIDQGLSPDEVMGIGGVRYRRFKEIIIEECQYRQRKEAPLKKMMHREWHVGMVDSGIETIIDNLCCEHGKDNVFVIQNLESGSFDLYNQLGSPPIVVIEDLDDSIKLKDLLEILGEYTNTTTHARYRDAIPLWTDVHIISMLSPEEYCRSVKGIRGFERLKSRLDRITYHYDENGQKKTHSCPATHYQSYEELKRNAKNKIIYGINIKQSNESTISVYET